MSHGLEQRLFCQKLFLIQYFDFLCKDIKRNWVSALLSSEMDGLSIGQGLTLLPGVPLNILSSVQCEKKSLPTE